MPAPQPGEMQRRHSSASSSDTASDHGLNSRHTSQENISIIPTRTTKVATSKPAANPLQFIKVGPCDLYRSAQEQLKKVEEVKKVKQEKRDEAEDWQSNLDNWKCSRRKRQEHIIERVVEVKKFELEEFDRNRRRSKTFSEMMEERNSKGRKMSLPVYKDDDNDLSDLGLGSSKQSNGVSGEDSVFEVSASEAATSPGTVKQNGTEEYTYESAIQSYVNFTESRVKGRTTEDVKTCNGFSKKSSPLVPVKPRRNSCKIEEKLSELEEIKKKSVSTTDLNTDTGRKSISVPKVDISKRRELFEKSTEEEQNSKINRLSNDFSSAKSIRERLSSLGKQNDETNFGSSKKLNCLPTEISVKDRLSNIEKNKCIESSNKVLSRASHEVSQQSVRDRLSSLQKETNSSNEKVIRNILPTDITSIQDRLCSLDAACHKEIPRKIVGEKEIDTNKQEEENKFKEESFNRALSPEEEVYDNKQQQHYRHRSLDSLDVDSNDGLGNESFERVQSLEDFDFIRNYPHPASSLSNDTDREDSGIHTADVSSSVSQADDCDEDLKLHHQPPIVEETNNLVVESEQSVSLSEIEESDEAGVVDTPTFMKLPLRLELDPLPVILESPSEPYPAFEFTQFEIKEKVLSNQELTLTETLNETVTEAVDKSFEDNNYNAFPESSTNSFCNTSSIDPVDILPEVPNLYTTSHPLSEVPDSSCENLIPDIPNALDTSNNPVNTSDSPLTVSDACMQDENAYTGVGDKRKTVVEICYKIDSSELSSPLPTPFISVDSDFNSKPQEKLEDHLTMGDSLHNIQTEKISPPDTILDEKTVNHFQALTVDVSPKESNVSEKILPIPTDILAVNKMESTNNTNENKPNVLFINSDFNLSGEVVFPLSPATLEPPKEKPPPPPTEISDDDEGSLNEKSSPLRRLDSTKRIKKEIRQKRSSFLGLNDGPDDDSYLEPELEVRPPPDMTTFLAEERRLEQMMYRQSICSESDSNQESRDSGVELEKHPDDLTWSQLHHSRDNSETFGNTSTTSEEEEIIKKEREIIEMLEQEELNRYKANSQNDQDNIGEKLAIRLRELEHEKSQIEWESREEAARRKADEIARKEHENRIQAREQELLKQETVVGSTDLNGEPAYEHDKHLEMEILLSEREHLEKEQEALVRQRETMMQQQWSSSMQDIPSSTVPVPNYRHSLMSHSQMEYRQSMPDLAATQPRRPPPPIPPSKPLIVPRNEEKRLSSPQQMSRQTIQALSAAPRSRLISNDNWMQTKRKVKVTQDNNYNYQHWLIQEAEHRRITEQHQRQAPPPRRPALPQTVPRPVTTPQYTNWQPPQQQKPSHEHQQWSTSSHRPSPPQQHQQWAVPQPRSDKPLPDSIIQTLTQRVQNRINTSDSNNNRRRIEQQQQPTIVETRPQTGNENQEKMLSVSGKKKCSHCGEELGRGAAMIIESLRLFYHINCFKCCVCCVQLGDGLMGTDVRVRNNKLHCHNCYSSDDGVKFSCV